MSTFAWIYYYIWAGQEKRVQFHPSKKGIQFIFLGNRKMGNLHNNNRWDLFLGVFNNFVKKVFWGLVSWKTFIIYFVSVGSRFRLAEDQRHSFSGSQPRNESDTRCMFTNISNIKDYNMSYGLWVPQRRCFWLCRIMTWNTGTFWPGRSCIHIMLGGNREWSLSSMEMRAKVPKFTLYDRLGLHCDFAGPPPPLPPPPIHCG